MTEMVGRVTKAIAEAYGSDLGAFERMARAAIAAMRDSLSMTQDASWPHYARIWLNNALDDGSRK